MDLRHHACWAFIFIGCASTFKPMEQNQFMYNSSRDTSGIAVQYMYNALATTGNTRYAEKARIQGVDVVAVKLTNNSGREIDIHRDVDFFIGNTPVEPQNPESSLAAVRQSSGSYAWWLLLMLVNAFKTEVTCDSYSGCREESQFIPIGLIIGPIIAFGNMGVASSANTAVIKEIADKNAASQILKPGQTYEGYLVFENAGRAALTAKLKQ